jgi:hypothetical protein
MKMKAILQQIEYNWWHFSIKVLDESPWIRENLPKIKAIWEMREEAAPYLVLSILGFPLGVAVGWLSIVLK